MLCLLALGCRKREDPRFFGTSDRRGRPPTTFYVNNHDEPEYIDPGLMSESTGRTLVLELFEGLLQQHPETLDPIAGVATRFDRSADGTRYRFHLRPDARWSDGQPVTARDFVYAWTRVLTPATGSRSAELMYTMLHGRGFHRGRVQRVTTATPLTTKPGAVGDETLAAGAAVRVIARGPATTPFVPLARALDGSATVELGKSASLTLGEVAGTTRQSPGPVEVLGVGDALACNGQPDRWLEVAADGAKGWLPGCALEATDEPTWAAVDMSLRVPAWWEGPEPREGAGFVATTALAADPAVLGFRAVGDHRLEVELVRAAPHFLEMLAYPAFFPLRQDVLERFAAAGEPDRWTRPGNLVGNGPYVLERHRFRYDITMVRNPHYHRHDELKVHRIVWLMVPSYTSTMNLYKTGEIDYVGDNVSLPQAYMEELAKYEDFHRSPYLSTYWYSVNTEKEPVDDPRVRHALDLAIDKQLIVDKVARGGQWPATHYVPSFVGSGYRQALEAEEKAGKKRFSGPGHDFDPERARGLLQEAGFPVEKTSSGYVAQGIGELELLYNTSEGHRALAVALQSMWKEHLGISVQLRNEEWKVMIKNLRDGHYQIARFGWVGDYNHPQSWLETFTSQSHNNWTRWGDPRFDTQLQKAAAIVDRDASMTAYLDAESMLVEAMPRIPLYFYTKSSLIKPYVKGYYPNVQNRHPIHWMWIDPDWKQGGENVPAMKPETLPAPGTM